MTPYVPAGTDAYAWPSAALTPRAELEGQMGDQTVGLQARMMSQAMRANFQDDPYSPTAMDNAVDSGAGDEDGPTG